MSSLTESSDDGLSQIIDDFLQRRRMGESPSVEELTSKYPHLEGELRELLPLVGHVEDASADAAEPTIPKQIGDYRIIAEVGRGAMGIVYRTWHTALDREVALKVLTHVRTLDEASRKRFRLESKVAARLHHRNIIPVFDVGETDGTIFFTMQLIDGVPLSDLRLSELPESTRETHQQAGGQRDRWMVFANILAQAADGLAHAHERGVIHRDIKPSNLILDSEWTLWISDFGVAKLADEDLTQTGDMPGTLRYMSPERLGGSCDERSDIYGLGATAYEVCTGRPLVDGHDRAEILAQIKQGDQAYARVHKSLIPKDLEAIIFQCVEKNPNHRYASASLLADDLRRFARGEPVQSRRITQLELLRRWAANHKVLAASLLVACASILLLVLGLGRLAMVQSQKRVAAEKHRQREEQLRHRSEQLAALANRLAIENRRSLYVAQMNNCGQLAGNAAGLDQMRQLLTEWAEENQEFPIQTGWELDFFKHLSSLQIERIQPWSGTQETNRQLGKLISNDGRLALPAKSGIQVISDCDQARLLTLPEQEPTSLIAWSTNAKALAVVLADQQVQVIDLNGSLIADGFNAKSIIDVAWLDDSRIVIAHDQFVSIWDIHSDWKQSIDTGWPIDSLHANGGLLVRYENDNCVWLGPGQLASERVKTISKSLLNASILKMVRGPIALHPREPILATARHHAIRLHDLRDGTLINRIEAQRHTIDCLGWNPSGDVLATSASGNVKLWDTRRSHLSSPTSLLRPIEFTFAYRHAKRMQSCAFATNDRLIFLDKDGGHLHLLRLGSEAARTAFPANVSKVSRHSLAQCPQTGKTYVADAERGLFVRDGLMSLILDEAPCSAVALQPDSDRIAYLTRKGELQIRENQESPSITLAEGNANALAWGTDATLFVAQQDGSIAAWDTTNQVKRCSVSVKKGIRKLDYCQKASLLAIAEHRGKVKLFDANLRLEAEFQANTGLLQDCSFSPDGKRLAVAFDDVGVIWDIENLVEINRLEGHLAGIFSIAWHPQQERIATGGAARNVCLWDARTGQLLMRVEGHRSPITTLSWDPAGNSLLSAGTKGFVFTRKTGNLSSR